MTWLYQIWGFKNTVGATLSHDFVHEPADANFSIDKELVQNDIDLIIHCGARVHWVQPYSALRASNVLSTMSAIDLCSNGKPKRLCFVSSTSVLDKDSFVALSQRSIAAGGSGISEADDLQNSRTGLGTGYGQSKWASEFVVREAGRRGLEGCIVRPGYVTGHPETGGKRSPNLFFILSH